MNWIVLDGGHGDLEPQEDGKLCTYVEDPLERN